MQPPEAAADSMRAEEVLDEAGRARLAALPERRRALFESLVAERARNRVPGPVELLRGGVGDPVVFVHPVGGQVFGYAELVGSAATPRPLYAMAADAALDAAVAPDFAELAARYLSRIERAGLWPAVFAGWSFGGVLAYEIARQFAERFEARPLLLVDSAYTPARYVGMTREPAEIGQTFISDLLLSGGHRPEAGDTPRELWDRPVHEALEAVLDQLTGHGIRLGLGRDDLLARHRVYANSLRALDGYIPEPCGLPVTFVRAEEWHEDLTELWRSLVPQLSVLSLPTDHYGLLRAPAVAAVARVLDELCAEA